MGGATASAESQRVAALVKRLHELGWIEGRTVSIEYRWAKGRSARLTEIAAEFVRLGGRCGFCDGHGASTRGKTGDIGHPNRLSFRRRPGRLRFGGGFDATGRQRHRHVQTRQPILPGSELNCYASLSLISADWQSWPMPAIPGPGWGRGEVEEAAGMLGLKVVTFEVRETKDIKAAFEALMGKAEALNFLLAIH